MHTAGYGQLHYTTKGDAHEKLDGFTKLDESLIIVYINSISDKCEMLLIERCMDWTDIEEGRENAEVEGCMWYSMYT
jgi:hypothetical protein